MEKSLKDMSADELGETVIVYDEQCERFAVGDAISFEGSVLIVKRIIPPTRPNGKWAIEV